jgi:hypothetical protein
MVVYEAMITQKRLKKILHYDPDTGIWTWIIGAPAGKNGRSGSRAGVTTDARGYRKISINYKKYYEHHLAFLYMRGYIPKEVDHKETKSNKWSNLREATASQNHGNSRRSKNNTSGFKGVTKHHVRQKWVAHIGHNRRQIYLGAFKTKEEAAAAYDRAATKYFGEFAAPNRALKD